MDSFVSGVSLVQSVEFFQRFSRFGGNEAMLQRLLNNDVCMERLIEHLSQPIAPSLIHGVFNTTENVLAAFKARCEAKGIDYGKFSWVDTTCAPEFDPDDPETVVVLDATLDTLKSTFEFAWSWTIDGQQKSVRDERIISGFENMALLNGLEFVPYTLRWVRIKLDINVGKTPVDVRNPKVSPGCALLFMSAEHPVRVKAMDYKKRFGYWIPGLKCASHDSKTPWRYALSVVFSGASGLVELVKGFDDSSNANLAIPTYRE